MAHGVRLSVALVLGLLHAVSAKRTCSPPVPCHSSCDTERSHLHCKACKCRACTMCAVDSKRSRSRTAKSRPAERLQRLGRSRQWAPEAEATAQSANRSAAAVLLRMMGYVPGLQIPLEFGGPGEDYQVDPSRHAALARAESAAAGPKVVPFYLQKAAAARGESAAASWLSSPVAQLLARAKARPPYRAQLEPATLAPKAAAHRTCPTSHCTWPSPVAQDARGSQDETSPVAAAQGQGTERGAPPLGGDAVERAQLVHELEARSAGVHSATKADPECSIPRRASSWGRGRHRQAQPARNDAAQVVRWPLWQAGQVRTGLLGAKRRQGQSLYLRRWKVQVFCGQVVVQRYWRHRHAGGKQRPEAAVDPGEAKRQAPAPKQ
jgi:hypothetical protein